MADLIRYSIDVAAKPGDVYAYAEDPKIGQLFAPAREVSGVEQNGGGRVKAFTTRQGRGQFTLHCFPQRFEAEYHWPGYRARYDVRCEPFGDKATRLTIEVNLQPQSFLGRVRASLTRLGVKNQVSGRLAALRQQFNR